jgi:hypothetical protein
MKARLLILTFIFALSVLSAAASTWTFIQGTPSSGGQQSRLYCAGSPPTDKLTCTYTLGLSTSAGNQLTLFLLSNNDLTGKPARQLTSAYTCSALTGGICDGIHNTVDAFTLHHSLGDDCRGFGGINPTDSSTSTDCATVSSSHAGGAFLSFSRSDNGQPESFAGAFYEAHTTTGTAVLDSVAGAQQTAGLSYTMTPCTVTGNDFIAQGTVSHPAVAPSVTAPYDVNQIVESNSHFSWSYIPDYSTGTAPTWTNSAPNSSAGSCVAWSDGNVPSTFTLNVTISAGSGTVTSSPAGINCPGTCSASFNSGTGVTLTETPGSGYLFTSWGGDCSGTSSTCSLTMSAAHSASAGFVSQSLATPALPTFSDNNELICGFTGQCVAGSAALTGNAPGNTPYVFSPAYEYTLGSSSWNGSTPPSCSFSLPYAQTFAGACSFIQAAEACRTGHAPGPIILDWPAGAYTTSSACIIPQTNTTVNHAVSPIIIRTAAYATLDTMPKPIGAGGIQDNVSASTQIGLRNPSLDGKNLAGLSVECPTQSAGTGGLAYQLGMQTFCIPEGNFTLANGLNPFRNAVGVPGCPTGAAQPNTACYNYLQFMVQIIETGTSAPFSTCSVGAGTSAADTCNNPSTLPHFGPDLWYWKGIVLSPQVGSSNNLNMFNVQDNQGNTTSTAQWASHFWFDSVAILGDWTTLSAGSNQFATGISMGQCAYCGIVNSSATQMLRPGGEGHIVGYNGVLGKMSNNWFEGQSICVFSGGAGLAPPITPIGSFVSAADFEFRRTRCTFPLAWLGQPNGDLPDANPFWGGANNNPIGTGHVNVASDGVTLTYVDGAQFHDSTSAWPNDNVFLNGTAKNCYSGSTLTNCKIVAAGSWPQKCGTFCFPSNPPTQLLLQNPICNPTPCTPVTMTFAVSGASLVRKNTEETKSSLRMLVSGSIFENADPSGGQRGINFILSNRNTSGGGQGTNYQNTHQDDNIQNNVFRNSCEDVSIGVVSNFGGGNGGGTSTAAQRVAWTNDAHLNITTLNPGCSTIGTPFGQQINVPFQTWTGTATSDGSHITFGSSQGTLTSVDAGAPVVSDTATYNSYSNPNLVINVTNANVDFASSETIHFPCAGCSGDPGSGGGGELQNGDFPIVSLTSSTMTINLGNSSVDPTSLAGGTKVQGPAGAQIFGIPTGYPVFLSGCLNTAFNTPTGAVGPLATTGSTAWNGSWTSANTSVAFASSLAATSTTCTLSNVQGKPNSFFITGNTYITDVPSVLGTGNAPASNGAPYATNSVIQDNLMLNAGTIAGTAAWFNSSSGLGEGNITEAFQFDISTLTASTLLIPRPSGASSLYAEYCNNPTVPLTNCTPASSNPPHMYFPNAAGAYASCAAGFVGCGGATTGNIPLNLPDMHSYALAPTSPYITASSTNGPIGTDFALIDAAQTANTYVPNVLGIPVTVSVGPFPDSLTQNPAPQTPTALTPQAFFAKVNTPTQTQGGTE